MVSTNTSNPQVIQLTKLNQHLLYSVGKASWSNSLPEGDSIVQLVDIEICDNKTMTGRYARAKLAESKSKLFYVLIPASLAKILLEIVGMNVIINKKLDKVGGYTSELTGKVSDTYKYNIIEMI